MISLQINGKPVQLESPTPLLAYLDQLGVNPRAVAVEHNDEIIERAAYESITLQEGDKVEIVRMVGGGASEARPKTLGERFGDPGGPDSGEATSSGASASVDA